MPTFCRHFAFAPNGRRLPHLPPPRATTRANTSETHRFSLTIALNSCTSGRPVGGLIGGIPGVAAHILAIPHYRGKWSIRLLTLIACTGICPYLSARPEPCR